MLKQSMTGEVLALAIGIPIADVFPASLDADVSCHLHQPRRNT